MRIPQAGGVGSDKLLGIPTHTAHRPRVELAIPEILAKLDRQAWLGGLWRRSCLLGLGGQ